MKAVVQKIVFATLLGATVLSAALAGADVTQGEARALKDMAGFNPGDRLVLRYSYKKVDPRAFFDTKFLRELERYGKVERELLLGEKQALEESVSRLEIVRRAGGLNPLLAKRRLLGEARYRKALWDLKRIKTDIEKAERLVRIARLRGAVNVADEAFVRKFDFVATHALDSTDDIVRAGSHYTALKEKPFKPEIVKVQQIKAKSVVRAAEILKLPRLKWMAGSSVIAMLAGYGYLSFETKNVERSESQLNDAVAKDCGHLGEDEIANCDVMPEVTPVVIK